MAKYKKGRKIKHTKTLYGKKKSKTKRTVITIITIIVLAGIGFIGYSVTPAIIDFFKNHGNDSNESWTPSVVDSSLEDSSSIESSEETNNKAASSFFAYNLPNEALVDEITFKNAIIEGKNKGYNAICVTLKQPGGMISYVSTNSIAKSISTKTSKLSLEQIVSIIKENGMTPIGKISVLNDNLAPLYNENIGYKFANENSKWLDNSVEKGGKPWISPFSNETKEYLNAIVAEISAAGITQIIASDVSFPPFRNYDLNVLGPTVQSPERYVALTTLLNDMNTAATANQAEVKLQVDFTDALTGKSEVFVPEKLSNISVFMDVNISNISDTIKKKDGTTISFKGMSVTEKMKAVIDEIKKVTGVKEIVPVINISSISDGDISTVKKIVSDAGFESYILIN